MKGNYLDLMCRLHQAEEQAMACPSVEALQRVRDLKKEAREFIFQPKASPRCWVCNGLGRARGRTCWQCNGTCFYPPRPDLRYRGSYYDQLEEYTRARIAREEQVGNSLLQRPTGKTLKWIKRQPFWQDRLLPKAEPDWAGHLLELWSWLRARLRGLRARGRKDAPPRPNESNPKARKPLACWLWLASWLVFGLLGCSSGHGPARPVPPDGFVIDLLIMWVVGFAIGWMVIDLLIGRD